MKKIEKIIVAIILVLSLMSIGFTMLQKPSHTNGKILIKADNQKVKEIPLNLSSESKIYDFQFQGNTGYVESKNGQVRILEMSKDLCPNGICSDTGWIDKPYQSIVCLPNKIIITIDGDKDDVIDVIP